MRFASTFHRCILAGAVLTLGCFSAQAADDAASATGKKVEAAIACINRLSERTHESQARYQDWAGSKAALTKKPRNVLGLYTIYETGDCAKGVQEAAAMEPHQAELEAASMAYVKAVTTLEPMLKEADDYYEQENYKDDKFAKGKEMHPKLLAAWKEFNTADTSLRNIVQTINDERQLAELKDVEQKEGKKARYHILNTMLLAKPLLASEGEVDMAKIDVAKVQEQITAYEKAVKDLEDYAAAHSDERIDSFLVNNAKNFLVTAKALMRRVRDKTKFDQGELMMLSQPGAGWMIDGSQPRLYRDYNELVDAFNRL